MYHQPLQHGENGRAVINRKRSKSSVFGFDPWLFSSNDLSAGFDPGLTERHWPSNPLACCVRRLS